METTGFIPLKAQQVDALPLNEWLEHQVVSYEIIRDGWLAGSKDYECYDLVVREYRKMIDKVQEALHDIKRDLADLHENNQLFSKEEAIQLLIKERERGVKIAYGFYGKNRDAFELRQKAGSCVAFVLEEVANECRLIGNSISGVSSLGSELGETVETILRKEFEQITKPSTNE